MSHAAPKASTHETIHITTGMSFPPGELDAVRSGEVGGPCHNRDVRGRGVAECGAEVVTVTGWSNGNSFSRGEGTERECPLIRRLLQAAEDPAQ